MGTHNAPRNLHQASLGQADPGDAGVIGIENYGAIVELVSSAAAETRTLSTPLRPGILATIRLKTDGGGDITMTAAGTLNVTGNNTAVFADAGQQLVLLSVSATTGYRWEVVVNTGTVVLSTV